MLLIFTLYLFLESISSQISLFEKTERLSTELKLLHRQFMSSFRATARKEAIWVFTSNFTYLFFYHISKSTDICFIIFSKMLITVIQEE